MALRILGAVATISFAFVAGASTYVSFGDSITAGFNLPVDRSYPFLIAEDENVQLENRAIGGQTACQMAHSQVFGQTQPTRSGGCKFLTMMIGTNDSNVEGIGDYERVFNQCQLASVTWLAVPPEHKSLPASLRCSLVGGWKTDAQSAVGTLSGDEMQCEITTEGGPIFIWYGLSDDSDGKFSYAVDGAKSTEATSRYAVNLKTRDGRGGRGASVVRIPNLAPGEHVVRLNVIAPDVVIYGIGTPAPARSAFQAPPLFVGGVPFQRNDASAKNSSKYNSDVIENIGNAVDDGLPVTFVSIRGKFLGQPGEMMDDLHPNELGAQHLRDAFESSIKGDRNSF